MKMLMAWCACFSVLVPALAFASSDAKAPDLTVERVQQMVDQQAKEGARTPTPESQGDLEGEAQSIPEVKGDFEGKVTRIIDAATIQIDSRRMHLAGINVPLQTHWGLPIDCYSADATQYLTDLVKDRTVSYSYDRLLGQRDRYGTRYVYVYLDGEMVNAKMLLDGKAFADRVRRYWQKEYFREAEGKARLRNLGVWHSCPVECVASGCRTKRW